MGFFEKIGGGVTYNTIPLDRVATPRQMSSYIKQLIRSSSTLYHESEALVVSRVYLNDPLNYGAIKGKFIVSEDEVDLVLPLMPHIINIPLVGEHVVVIEYNGQHYYTSIINRKNSPSENAIPIDLPKNTKYGDTFQRNTKISRVNVNEGDIVYEGRFGNSIKLGSNPKNQSPNIRIRAGQDKQFDDVNLLAKENINQDGSSIYLSTDETISIYNPNFPTKTVNGNSIVINSDKLFFNGRKGNVDIRASNKMYLEADEIFINAKKAGTIKMGDPRAPMIPTVNGQKLLEFQAAVLGVLSGIQKILTNVGLQLWPLVATDTLKLLKNVHVVAEGVTKQTFLHKEVLIADPDWKLPDVPPLPPLPDPDVMKAKIAQGIKIPETPSLDRLKEKVEESSWQKKS